MILLVTNCLCDLSDRAGNRRTISLVGVSGAELSCSVVLQFPNCSRMVGRKPQALYKGFIPTTNQAGLALACMFLRGFNNSELSVSAWAILHSVRLCFMKLADRRQHAQNLSMNALACTHPLS